MAASTGEGFPPDRSGAREPVPVGAPGPPPALAQAPVRRRAPRREIRALLRAHLAAASGYRHLTRHCAVCARLLRLAMEPLAASGPPDALVAASTAPEPPRTTTTAAPAPAPPEQTAEHVMAPGPPPPATEHVASSGGRRPPPTV